VSGEFHCDLYWCDMSKGLILCDQVSGKKKEKSLSYNENGKSGAAVHVSVHIVSISEYTQFPCQCPHSFNFGVHAFSMSVST
jgi:hypothetical protein